MKMKQQEIETLKLAAKAIGYEAGVLSSNPIQNAVLVKIGDRRWRSYYPLTDNADAMEIQCKLPLNMVRDARDTKFSVFNCNTGELLAMEYFEDHPSKEVALGWALVKAAAATVKDNRDVD